MSFEKFATSYESINPEVFGIRLTVIIMFIIGIVVIATMALNVTSLNFLYPALIVFSGLTLMAGLFFYDVYSNEKKDELVVNYAHGLESKKAEVLNVVKQNTARKNLISGDGEKFDEFIVTSVIDGKNATASVDKKDVSVFYDLGNDETAYMTYSILDIDSNQFSILSEYNGVYVKEIHLNKGYVIEEIKDK